MYSLDVSGNTVNVLSLIFEDTEYLLEISAISSYRKLKTCVTIYTHTGNDNRYPLKLLTAVIIHPP